MKINEKIELESHKNKWIVEKKIHVNNESFEKESDLKMDDLCVNTSQLRNVLYDVLYK